MAAKRLDIDQDSFSCSICLDLLNNPVTIPCGHSYCMRCVDTHWNGEEDKQSYSCPQCRHMFTQRPVLVKNTVLAILMEGLKNSGPRPAAVCPPSAAAVCPSASGGDVLCDLCSERKVRAFKSCLQCLVSYCKEHLQPHYDVPALKKHKLVEPTDSLQENICSRHDEVMKMFCRTDQQCICYLCSVDQHKEHDTVTAAAERAEKQKELQGLKQKILLRLDHKNKDMDHLKHQVKSSSHSVDAAVELCDRGLKELVALLENRMSEVKQQVRAQQEAEEHRVKELQDQVQQEITELKRTLTELDTLSHTEEHVHFLHKFASLSKVRETSVSVNSSRSLPPFQDIATAAVSKLRSSLQKTSLMEPSDVLHKLIVTPKTDGPPAGAQAAAPPQQTSQSVHPQPIQVDAPSPPLQNSEGTSPMDFAAMVHRLKLNSPDGHPEGIKVTAPPEGATLQERYDYIKQTFKFFPLGYLPMPSWPSIGPPPPSLQDSEEYPALSHHKKTGGRPPRAQVTTTAGPSIITFSENFPALPHRNLKLKNPAPCSKPSQSSDKSYYSKMKKHARRLTWDPRSLNDKMELSNENCSVKRMAYSQRYKPHPFRFTTLPQVVSKESLTGQCYFEVLTDYDQVCTIAVTYKDIRRDGSSDNCNFGMNAKSWAVEYHHGRCAMWHNGRREAIEGSGHNIGIFVDYKAGLLSFFRYHCSEFQNFFIFKTTFTGPLAAGVRLDEVGSTVKFSTRMFNDPYEDD